MGKHLCLGATDGGRFHKTAEHIAAAELAKMASPGPKKDINNMFLPKAQMTLGVLVAQSVVGPIGVPGVEAVYPPIVTTDGKPMNTMHDYVIRMSKKDLPPAGPFWSVTLYDAKNGFFIPNDRKKYSVGDNAGMKLNKDGGIEIYIAAKKPNGMPEENWLPINRKDEDLSVNLRIYVPDMEKMKTWTQPKAEKLAVKE
jgi:hypothetical protein